MSYPLPPTRALDWTQLSMDVKDQVNGHVEVTYKHSAWQEPRFVENPVLRVHGLSPSLNYGQQAHEGMKAYRDPNGQIRLFRLEKHCARMAKSATFISIPSVPLAVFRHAIHLAISRNSEFVPPLESGAALYVRPVVIGYGPSIVPAPPSEFLFFVFVQPISPYLGTRALDAVLLEDYDRSAPLGTGGVKIGGNYAPIMRLQARAAREGFGLILHLDSKTHTQIDEFSTAGFVGVLQVDDRITLVISASENIIDSITTDSVAEIAKHLGWTVERRLIHYDELRKFQEVIAAGTAASLVPVRSVSRTTLDHKFVYGNGDRTSACTRLRQHLLEIQQGVREDMFGWTEIVSDVFADETIDALAKL